MKAQIKITEEVLSDILITAFDANYGGCWRWCEPDGIQVQGRNQGLARGDHEDIWISVTVINNIQEDERRFQRKYIVNHKVLISGIEQITSTTGSLYHGVLIDALAEGDTGMIDANMADTIVQLGLWREEIYS